MEENLQPKPSHTSFSSSYSLEIDLGRGGPGVNVERTLPSVYLQALSGYLQETKEESLKTLKLNLAGIVSSHLAIWSGTTSGNKSELTVDCGIPIPHWLGFASGFLGFEVFIIMVSAFVIDGYLEREARPRQVMRTLKSVAVAQTLGEFLFACWIVYGLEMFYSEDNQCNWESKHSFGYVVMFIVLTLGLILVLKWMMKALDLVWCLAHHIVATTNTTQLEEE